MKPTGSSQTRIGIYGVHMLEILVSCDAPQMAVTDYTGAVHSVKTRSNRYKLFQLNKKCVCCGIEGSMMSLERTHQGETPHFNLYGIRNDKLILMTQDHILPKSKGGRDILSNLQTMCQVCNSAKRDKHMTIEELRQFIIHELHSQLV